MEAAVSDMSWPCRCFECIGDSSCNVCGARSGEICAWGCSEHPRNREPCPTIIGAEPRPRITRGEDP